jgi:hypothetical protein
MGMFDSLVDSKAVCKNGCDLSKFEFQTKMLDCTLDVYHCGDTVKSEIDCSDFSIDKQYPHCLENNSFLAMFDNDVFLGFKEFLVTKNVKQIMSNCIDKLKYEEAKLASAMYKVWKLNDMIEIGGIPEFFRTLWNLPLNKSDEEVLQEHIRNLRETLEG